MLTRVYFSSVDIMELEDRLNHVHTAVFHAELCF